MKKIINGLRYDTETAEYIETYENDYPTTDFNWYSESLYRTKKGNWFLCGEGGPMSKYAVSCGNSTSGGKGLRPLFERDAQAWLEKHDFGKELEEYFGTTIQDA